MIQTNWENEKNNNNSKERQKITLIKIVKIYISIKNVTKKYDLW